MRILFLDVHGVLNWNGSWKNGGIPWNGEAQSGTYILDPKCCGILSSVCDELDLTVVLSSSWRMHTDHLEYLRERGMLWRLHTTDPFTPDVPPQRISQTRGREIEAWLSKHPEVTKYAIVDDNSDMLPDQRRRFVQTSMEYGGFGEKHAKHLRRIFGAV